ncbi:hypothetical protein FOL47_007968 [Perkinsus chesapeaki]|uniref:K Homology domain-containing protein n=1 Tax=Perkinsus chesapeaki TaxID=330153 RepID=A0A7J6LGS4_PERCH|nr:hypothetical protein FOL47_007968 [Perkinsus chesapeaki]
MQQEAPAPMASSSSGPPRQQSNGSGLMGHREQPPQPFEFGPDAGPYRDQVEVSQELVPMVIGKRGATIMALKQQTGANIYVVMGQMASNQPPENLLGDQSTRDQGFSIFYIDAQTEEQLQAAVDAVREKISPLEPKQGEIQKFFEIPDHKVPEVLGPQGVALARIKERSGARLEIKAIPPSEYHGSTKGMPRTVNCVGTEEAVTLCEELVNKVVSGTVTCADLIAEYESGHPEFRAQKRLSSTPSYDDTKRRRTTDFGGSGGGFRGENYEHQYNAGYQRGPPSGGYGGRGGGGPAMRGSGGKGGGGWNEAPTDVCVMDVPSSSVGAIIGRGGEIINQLKEDGRCDIQVAKSSGPYREVYIHGPYDGLLTIVGFINERLGGTHVIKSPPAQGLPPYLYGSNAGGPNGPGMAPPPRGGGHPMSGGPGRMSGGGPRPYMPQSSPLPSRNYGGDQSGPPPASQQGYSTPPASQPWQQQHQPMGGYPSPGMMQQQQPAMARSAAGPGGPGGYYPQQPQQYANPYQQQLPPHQGYMPPAATQQIGTSVPPPASQQQQSPYQYQSPAGSPPQASTQQPSGGSAAQPSATGATLGQDSSTNYASAYLAAAWQQYYASLHRQQQQQAQASDKSRLEMAVTSSSKKRKTEEEEEMPKLNRDLEEALDNVADDEDESSSSSSDEDSDAEMLTEGVEKKIMDTLNRIKSHDPTLKETKEPVFKDDDFVVENAGKRKKREKKLTHKELMRKRLLEEGAEAAVDDDDEEEQKVAQTSRQAGEDARRALMDAMGVDEDSESAADSDDDFLVVRGKTAEEQDEEDREYKKWERGQLAKAANEGNEQILMERYFRDTDEGGENKLDNDDAFLRDYIMNKGWLEKQSMQPNEYSSDGSDDELDREDDFEREYNFRFEEEKGASLVGHSRNVNDSVRVKDDKRKRKRQEKEARKAEEKAKRAEELKRLKNLKRQEIQRRLEVIAKVTGSSVPKISESGEKLLDGEWDPQAHDKLMRETVLGEGYDDQEESAESVEAPTPEDVPDAESTAGFANDESTQWGQWDGLEAQDEAEREEQDDEHEWWLCDGCQKPILPGKRLFQCKQCEDYALCQPCHKNTTHRHAFVKSRVPDGCEPPTGVEQMLSKEKEEEYEMDFEDMIGDLPTRFKYRKVEPGSIHNLNAEDIISKSDKELNQIASLKLYAPYLDEGPRETKREPSGGFKEQGKGKGGKGKGKGKGEGAAAVASRAEAYGISKRKIQKAGGTKRR